MNTQNQSLETQIRPRMAETTFKYNYNHKSECTVASVQYGEGETDDGH